MVLSVFVSLAVALIAAYAIYRVASRAWKNAEVDDKLDEVDTLNENYERVKDLDVNEVKEKKKRLRKILKQ